MYPNLELKKKFSVGMTSYYLRGAAGNSVFPKSMSTHRHTPPSLPPWQSTHLPLILLLYVIRMMSFATFLPSRHNGPQAASKESGKFIQEERAGEEGGASKQLIPCGSPSLCLQLLN